MSAIPPNWMSSIVGGVSAGQRAGEARSKSDGTQARSVDGDAFADKLKNTIENEDADAQVDSDAEGMGSQGRAFSDAGDQDQPDDTPKQDDDTPASGLDLTA